MGALSLVLGSVAVHVKERAMRNEPKFYVFSTRAEADEQGRALVGPSGNYEIQRQPAFRVPTHPRLPDEFVPERFLLLVPA